MALDISRRLKYIAIMHSQLEKTLLLENAEFQGSSTDFIPRDSTPVPGLRSSAVLGFSS